MLTWRPVGSRSKSAWTLLWPSHIQIHMQIPGLGLACPSLQGGLNALSYTGLHQLLCIYVQHWVSLLRLYFRRIQITGPYLGSRF